jgi:Flp pilus assembly protein TadD
MLDVQLFGMTAGLHHVVNVLLHVANVLLLFGVLRRMTGAFGPSAFVAALFAVHPLHVESVAWIAERKDVLSTLFFMLTLWGYVGYVQKRGAWRYAMLLACFALGLMTKPMLVTLPFVLLLLDWWPLGRAAGSRQAGRVVPQAGRVRLQGWAAWGPLIVEKLPLFALSAGASAVAFFTQERGGAMGTLQWLPVARRIGNALVAYAAYLGKTFWPAGLSPFYPLGDSVPPGSVAGAVLVLAVVSAVVARMARRRPHLAVGWLWYLGTLLPVIGLVQVGLQSMADRFTYVPLIGIFIAVAWGVPELTARWRPGRVALPAAAALIVLACVVTARAQVGYWRDSVALWTRATELTLHVDTYQAHMGLGATLAQQGRVDEAIGHFSEAARLKPESAEADHELGLLLAGQGRIDEALAAFTEAVRRRPSFAEAHSNLGLALARKGRTAEAMDRYAQALALDPDLPGVHNNLGVLLDEQGKVGEALPHYAEAVRLRPDFELARVNLGVALARTGRMTEAIGEFREALRINPGNPVARRAVDELTARGKSR